VRKCGLNASGSGQGSVVGCCEHGDEPPGSVKGGKFLDKLNDCWLLRKDTSP
jgi:hypothetical protein